MIFLMPLKQIIIISVESILMISKYPEKLKKNNLGKLVSSDNLCIKNKGHFRVHL
jgi:hypothetical protein